MNDDQNNHDEQPAQDPFAATFQRLNQLIAEGVKPRPVAIAQAAEQTGVDLKDFRKHFQSLARQATAAGTPEAPKVTRRQLKIDKTAGEVLDKFATLNSLGFAPSVQEVLDRASFFACRHIATMYDQATAKMQKLEP